MQNEDIFAKYGGQDAQMLSIDLMEGHDFEYWCAGLLRKIGFSHVEVTPGSNDQGVDILAQKDGVKYAIQCKRYSHDLGNTPVQEVHAGKAMYNCHVGVVLTNQHFTTGAKQLAKATGVLLWDRDWIKSHLEVTPTGEVIDESLEGDELFSEAVDAVLETCQASVSMIQRRLKLGYARAARIVDEMEEKGIVGPFQGSKPRVILITKEEWDIRTGKRPPVETPPKVQNRVTPDLDPVSDYCSSDAMVEFPEPPPPAISKHIAPLLCFLSVCIPFLKVCFEDGFMTGEPADIITDIICTLGIPMFVTYLCIFKNPKDRFYQKWWFWVPFFILSFFVK